MSDVRLKISPPWVVCVKKLEALFDGDPQIAFNVDFSGKAPSVVLACNNGDKVAALMQLLPDEYEFGNVKLKVAIDGTPSNRAFANKKELLETAFKGNPVFVSAVSPVDDGYAWFSMVYVIFQNHVVQFFADNLCDAFGVISTLYQDIAEEVLIGDGAQGVYFCTNVEVGKLGMPLGEWP